MSSDVVHYSVRTARKTQHKSCELSSFQIEKGDRYCSFLFDGKYRNRLKLVESIFFYGCRDLIDYEIAARGEYAECLFYWLTAQGLPEEDARLCEDYVRELMRAERLRSNKPEIL